MDKMVDVQSGIAEAREIRSCVRELRAELGEESVEKIVGYAAVFNSRSLDLGGFVEVVAPGAFSESIAGDADIRALVNHDSAKVIGRSKAGTLLLSEDEVGLRVEIVPGDTSYARDIAESIRRGDIDQMSFGFTVDEDMFETLDDGTVLRTLNKVSIFEVSIVSFPAYKATSVSMRSMENYQSHVATSRSVDLMKKKLRLAELVG